MQSITWEAVRGLFTPEFKTAGNKKLVENIWKEYKSGKATLDETRQRIVDTAGGIRNPSWFGSGGAAVAENAPSVNPRQLPSAGNMGESGANTGGGSNLSGAGASEVGAQRFMPAGSQNVPKHYESVDSFREHWNALGVRNMTDIRAKGTPYEHIRPSEIEVEKANRNKGLGTAFMQDLVSFADSIGKQVRINPSDELGATSKSRLEKFYKRFGFVENKPGKNKDYSISERFYRQPSSGERFMPSPDSSMPGAYSFTGGYRALPGKSKGSLRIYSPAGSLIGIAASLDEAQRIIRKKSKQ
jgi:GNAT superfamily N-acetyltransferase